MRFTPLVLTLVLSACGPSPPADHPFGGRLAVHCTGDLACPFPEPVGRLQAHGDVEFRGRPHLGADLSGAIGDVVTAPCAGTIVFAGAVGGYGSHAGTPGPVTLLQCADVAEPLVVMLGHCEAILPQGTPIARGDRVCALSPYLGPAGEDWSHLHLAARRGQFGDGGDYYIGYADGAEVPAHDGGAWVDPLSWRASADADCAFDGQNPDTTHALAIRRGAEREVEIVYLPIGRGWSRLGVGVAAEQIVLASTDADGRVVDSFLEPVNWFDAEYVTSLGRGQDRAPADTPAIFTFRFRVPDDAPLGRVKVYFAPARPGAERALCGVGTHFWLDVRPARVSDEPVAEPAPEPPACVSVVDADFDMGLGEFETEIHAPDLGRISTRDGLVEAEIHRASESWSVQIKRPQVAIAPGQSWRLSLRARADASRPLTAELSMMDDPWLPVGLHTRFDLTREWQRYDARFTTDRALQRARLNLALAGERGRVEIDSVHLERCD